MVERGFIGALLFVAGSVMFTSSLSFLKKKKLIYFILDEIHEQNLKPLTLHRVQSGKHPEI